MMAIYLKGQTQLAAEVESTEVVGAEHHVRATLGHKLTDLLGIGRLFASSGDHGVIRLMQLPSQGVQ